MVAASRIHGFNQLAKKAFQFGFRMLDPHDEGRCEANVAGDKHCYSLVFARLRPADGITRRKETENALREHERLMNPVLGQLPGLAYRCLVNKDWTVIYAGGHFGRIGGIEADDLVAGRIQYGNILHPDDAEYCARTVAEAIARRGVAR